MATNYTKYLLVIDPNDYSMEKLYHTKAGSIDSRDIILKGLRIDRKFKIRFPSDVSCSSTEPVTFQ